MPNNLPNILLIFADQMRGMDMGCAGNPDVITPNMDRLAEEGMYFLKAYANTPVCTPSRGSLLTGLYPLSHLAITNDLPIATNIPSVGKILKEAGYYVGYIGKWHLDGVPRDKFTPPGPRRLGFDDFWAVWNCSHDYFNAYYYRDTPEPIPLRRYEPIGQTDLAIEFIEESLKEKRLPFFLVLSWGPPHDPYWMVPEEYRSKYKPDEITLRPNVKLGTKKLLGPKDANLSPKETIANYYAAITALDEQLGRILEFLNDNDLTNETIVIFTSDHGDMLWSQGMMKKEQPFEESINIPFVIRWPKHIPSGEKNNILISIVDIAPSILGLLGIKIPEEIEGTDLSRVILGLEDKGPDSVFLQEIVPVDEGYAQGIREWRGVRTSRYTYACWQTGEGWLLYDNETDPYQMENLIDNPKYRSVREEMERILQYWLKRTNDPFLKWDEHIRRLGLVELWNERELYMHPNNPRLIDSSG
ncbi:sulfatase [bacterium]|nr:sulfatase [bacterium]